jgi:5-methylcytosine-specific restriction protein A
LILALDLYFKIPRSAIKASHPDVVELSQLLNRLRSADPSDPVKFRNPNGVGMKLHNYGSLDGSVSGSGLSHGGRLDAAVWNEFSANKSRLSDEVSRIKQTLSRAAHS